MKPTVKISIFPNTHWLFVGIRKTVDSSQMQKLHSSSHTHPFFFFYPLQKLIFNILLYVWPCDYKINLPLGQIHLTCLRNNQEAWLVPRTIFFWVGWRDGCPFLSRSKHMPSLQLKAQSIKLNWNQECFNFMLQALIPAGGGAGYSTTLAISGVILSHQRARHTAGRTLFMHPLLTSIAHLWSPALLYPSMTGSNFTSSTIPKCFIKMQNFLIKAPPTEFCVEGFT